MKEPTVLRYLTDAAFEIVTPDGIVVVDLGEFTPKEMLSQGIVAAISTHQHSDHCDRPKLAELGIPVWAPSDTTPLLIVDGVKDSRPLSPSTPLDVTSSLTVTAMPVCHGRSAKPILNFGLIIEIGGWRIWHTGDLGYDSEPRPEGNFDLVAIGIGGTYIFDAEEAAGYLTALGHQGPAVAMHWEYAQEMGKRFLAVGEGAAWTPLLLGSGESYILGGGE